MKTSNYREALQEHWSNLWGLFRMLARSRLPRVVALMCAALALGGAAITLVEGKAGPFHSIFNSVWWTLTTMTTVGYGDMVPVTHWGRMVGAGIILTGVLLISTFTATVSSIFVEAKIKEGKGLQQINYRDHLVVCGLSHITRQFLSALQRYAVLIKQIKK